MFGLGSKAVLTAPKSDFSFTLESGLKSGISRPPIEAASFKKIARLWFSFDDIPP
jgi:hypothetical protein